MALLWLHVIAVFAFGLALGFGFLHVTWESGIIALGAVWATSERGGRTLRTLAACLGLVTSSAVLTHFSGGYIEMHFHFFIMLAVIALYYNWLAFLVSIAYVAAHHGIVGYLDPASVYNHEDAIANPFKWAAIHAGFITGASAVYVIGWRLTEMANEETARSEEKFSKAFYRSPLAISLTGADERMVDVNDAFTRLTGFRRKECIGHTSLELGLWTNRDDRAMIGALIQEKGSAREIQTQFRTKKGNVIDALITAEVIDIGGRDSVLSLVHDITARVQAEAQVRESEARFRALIENASDVILVMSRTGEITYASPSMEAVMGYRPEDLVGLSGFTYVHEDDQPLAYRSIELALTEVQKPAPIELMVRHDDGGWRTLEATVDTLTDTSGETSVVVNCRDITQRKEAERTIRWLAYHDSLTTLPNRALLEDRLALSLAQAQRNGEMVAIIFVDLDEFKLINDTLGHPVGDELIRGTAERLKSVVRDGDTVARVGGDEFVVLLRDSAGADYVVEVAERINQGLNAPHLIADQELTVTASCGISIYPTDGEDTATLLRNADTAMYRAKDAGRNGYELYTAAMGEDVRERLTLQNELRRAIQEHHLLLHYQPIIDVSTGELRSCEVLVRWQHPKRGLVMPGEFIGAAERAGLITALSELVMRSACLQHKDWQEAGLDPVPVAVNVSSHRFQYSGFGEMTLRTLEATGLDPRWLILEITEGVLMEDIDRAAGILEQLREAGTSVSIDDFGTGYSSLSYLKHLPIDNLKIDRSFIAGISHDRQDESIIRAIIALARSLNLNVIAEGVERQTELSFLRDEGCSQAQGYFFARPMPAEEFEELLRSRRALAQASSQ